MTGLLILGNYILKCPW